MNKLAFILALYIISSSFCNRVVVYDELPGNRKQIKMEKGTSVDLVEADTKGIYRIVSAGAGVSFIESNEEGGIATLTAELEGTWLVQLEKDVLGKKGKFRKTEKRFLTVKITSSDNDELAFLN